MQAPPEPGLLWDSFAQQEVAAESLEPGNHHLGGLADHPEGAQRRFWSAAVPSGGTAGGFWLCLTCGPLSF